MMNPSFAVPAGNNRIVADIAFRAAASVVDTVAVVGAVAEVVDTALLVVVASRVVAAGKIAYRNSSMTVVPDSFVRHTGGTGIPATL
jgi:hypothetical protein